MAVTFHKELTELLLTFKADKTDKSSDTDRIFEIVYNELRRLASGLMCQERADHTLQPTALVHEAYCRLIDQTQIQWQNRAHFFGVASRAMRQILVEHARRRATAKRGKGLHHITLDERLGIGADPDVEISELDDALNRLEELDERMARVVELHVFGGLREVEVAHVLGTSRRTVQRDWQAAKLWLCRELSGGSTS
jgi:RNA polymerase sigma factor (TIGR02999 family)